MPPLPPLHMVTGKWSPNENTTTGITSNMQLTIYNTLKNKVYVITVRANYPSGTGLSGSKQYTTDITPAANSISFGISAYPASANTMTLTLNSNKESIAIPRSVYGTWNFTVTITQQSNTSNTVYVTTPNLRVFPRGTSLPVNFIYLFNSANDGNTGIHGYNGLIQANPSYASNTFVIGESHLPFTADHITAKGGDDKFFVGNWSWKGPNKTSIVSTPTAFLPLTGACTDTTPNGASASLNFTITKAAANSIDITTKSGICNSISTNYDAGTGSNTVYGTWGITGRIFEYAPGYSTIHLPYDDADPKFTGVYDGYYYAGVQLQNKTSVQLSLNILPPSSVPSITESSNSIRVTTAITFTAIPHGGESPYSYLFYIYNSNSNALVASSGKTVHNTYTYVPSSAGGYYAKVISTDNLGFAKNSTKVYFSANRNFGFGTPTITVPDSTLVEGHSETITANIIGGSLPYKSFAWSLNGNHLITTNTPSITFNGNASDMRVDTLTVVVTDNAMNTATATGTVNVVNGASITLSPDSVSTDAGSSITYMVSVTGGTGPFTVELYNITGKRQQGVNVTISSPGGSNSIVLVTGSTGTFTYNAIATDKATNAIFESSNAVLTVNQKPTNIHTQASSGGGGGGFGGGSSLPTLSILGNCTTISNFSQDNQERLILRNQTFTVVENYINPTSAGVSVNGATYLLQLNQKQLVKSVNGINYTLSLTNVSYLPIQHTIKVAMCYRLPVALTHSSVTRGSMIVTLTTNKTISVQNGPVLLTGSITNGTTGPYKYDFILTNNTGAVAFNHTNTNLKTTNSTVFVPYLPGIYTASLQILSAGTTTSSKPRSFTVSALQKPSITTIKATTTAKPVTAPPASVSSWIILLIILLIIILLAIMYYYMKNRRQQAAAAKKANSKKKDTAA